MRRARSRSTAEALSNETEMWPAPVFRMSSELLMSFLRS